MDDQILSLYAKGMSTRDIVDTFDEMYGAEISPGLLSQVTNAVIEQVNQWQHGPLDAVYPLIYLDCIVIKSRQDKRVINQSLYLALGINLDGHKELLGMWLSENEGAKFWLPVLTELQNRGVAQVLIACVEGLTGFPDAINRVYPDAKIQLCMVHRVRHSLKYVVWKDYKAVAADLKRIYQSSTEDEAQSELESFSQKWDGKYPQISKSWTAHWPNILTLFEFSKDIRKAIYTTNAIVPGMIFKAWHVVPGMIFKEWHVVPGMIFKVWHVVPGMIHKEWHVKSLSSVIRKSTKTRKLFPNDNSALKVVYLAIQAASKKWTMPIQNRKQAMNRFIIPFEEQLTPYL